ncbi:hypothetical protein IOC51_06560 [Vibrio parahaemolyticus]|uniref:DNA N-6-adenine-methyltransferase n=1 Tax=Vibrio parahaemolyticus TaxID=670 RepID=UPI001E63E0EC|nr:DNA N-6-adenine-methyltransferase [Vibrio parahaemolyticus]MCD1413697.1 hypothetical protein [Vibrio parahaemolyticus]
MRFATELEFLPLQSDEELKQLEESIRNSGFNPLFPIVTFEDEIFDGRNRYLAARAAEVPAVFTECASREEALRIAEQSYLQRVFTVDQKVMAKALFSKIKHGQNQHTTGGSDPNLLNLAEQAGASQGKMKKAVSVKNKVESGELSPAIQEQVLSGQSTVNNAYEASKEAERIAESTGQSPMDVSAAIARIADEEGVTLTQAVKQYQGPHLMGNGDDEWYTPPKYTDDARSVMGSIDVDPASNDYAQTRIQAGTYYTEETNGLDKIWKGNVWLNPPYSKGKSGCAVFVDRLVALVRAEHVTQAVVLTNSLTDTNWSHSLFSVATLVAFPKGRIKFERHPDHAAPKGKEDGAMKGQMFTYIGDNPQAFVDVFGEYCRIFKPMEQIV